MFDDGCMMNCGARLVAAIIAIFNHRRRSDCSATDERVDINQRFEIVID